MKSNKKEDDLEEFCTSVMRYLEGEEVVAGLSWDASWYYVWMYPTSNFEDFCEEIERDDLLIGLENDLAQIGVNQFCDLEGVNDFLRRYCGDDEPAEFYEDDWGNICGA